MRRKLEPAERLIVAFDFKPQDFGSREGVRKHILELAEQLKGTGVCIKLNSSLRAFGYEIIDAIRQLGLSFFADLKLNDIDSTLSTDGEFLEAYKPELLTFMCSAGPKSVRALKQWLPTTELIGVTVLTHLTEQDTDMIHRCAIEAAVLNLAGLAKRAGADGLVASPMEAGALRSYVGDDMSINTPAVRPSWSIVKGDNQNPDRIMTPAKAIQAGADRIVVGRPIVQAENPYDAVMRTIDELATIT